MKLLRVGAVPVSANKLLRMHWAVRQRQFDAWYWMVRSVGGKPKKGETSERMYVRITQNRRKLLDKDNLYGSVKPIMDVLVRIGWLKDDDPTHVLLQVEQAPCGKQKPYTEILIDTIPSTECGEVGSK